MSPLSAAGLICGASDPSEQVLDVLTMSVSLGTVPDRDPAWRYRPECQVNTRLPGHETPLRPLQGAVGRRAD